MINFGLIGAGGYIAPRHMRAIKDTGNRLVAALDRYDGVGIMDSYFPEADFFIEPERFDRHLDKLRRKGPDSRIDYVSICSPNYLHDSHMRLALRNDAHAICEKPLVLNPWNLDALAQLEQESGKRIFTILQLRLHPAIIELHDQVAASPANHRFKVKLEYITSRGHWYHISWKGDLARSGGIATNIGIHFFDMLAWIFGKPGNMEVKYHEVDRAAGWMQLDKADVEWQLSINDKDLPPEAVAAGKRTYRTISVDGAEVEFSEGFTDLHTRSYEKILQGEGFGLEDARRSIEIAQAIRPVRF